VKIIRASARMHRVSAGWKARRQRIALVPTMGFLHGGHRALIRAARRQADQLIVSLFVNPIQFNRCKDYETYPRDFRSDALLAQESGADVLFAPALREVYPEGFGTFVDVEGVTERWEGEFRPGHFRGVATVVLKLFLNTLPDVAFFGWKDYQQVVTLQKMVRDLNVPVRIRAVPTIREQDGLAMSSRNVRLSPESRAVAPRVFQSLLVAREAFQKGERAAHRIRMKMLRFLSKEPRIRVEYIALCTADRLEPVTSVSQETVVLIAVWMDQVRLIDNLLLGP